MSEELTPERAKEILKASLAATQRDFDDTIREIIRIRESWTNEQAK